MDPLLIGNILRIGMSQSPGGVAATLGPDAVTFAELDQRAEQWAHRLSAVGIRRGHLVAHLSDPDLDTLAHFLACARVGAIFMPLNPRLSEGEVAAIVAAMQPDLMLLGTGQRDRSVADVATLDSAAAPAGVLDAVIEGPASMHEAHMAYLTSGSTGVPKAVAVSHLASWLRSSPGGGTFARPMLGKGGVVCTFPLCHYGGWHYVMEAWQHGSPVHLVSRAHADDIVTAVAQHQALAIYCIPAVWQRVLEHRGDLSSLAYADTGTSAVSLELITSIKQRIPASTTAILYGSTEVGPMAGLQDADVLTHPGSVGQAAFPTALTLSDDGEVLASSPAMMNGYLRRPDLTAAVFDDQGRYRSGDLGEECEGYWYLSGRRSELIRTGGEFVAPSEVEAVLRRHTQLAHARDFAVVGLPDPTWGEVVCLAVDADQLPTIAELRRDVEAHLSPHKIPRRVLAAAAIPRTPATGQVQRNALLAQLRPLRQDSSAR